MELPVMSHPPPPLLRAAVLVGGGSTRMGRPKAWLDHGHGPHALHLVQMLSQLPNVQEVVLSGALPPNPPPGIAELPHCPDGVAGVGPLGALLGLFARDPESAWLVVGCDLALLEADLLEWLSGERRPSHYATVPVSPEGRHETVLAIYEPPMVPRLEQMWREGRKSLQRQFSHWPIHAPQVPDFLARQLVNVNTPEELAQVQPQPSTPR